MKKGMMIAILATVTASVLPALPADAKTTVKVDRVTDKVTVRSSDWSKPHRLKYKLRTVYGTGPVKLLRDPKAGAKAAAKEEVEVPLTRIAKGKTYSVVRYDIGKRRYFFVKNSSLTTKKPAPAKYTASQFKRAGVVHWSGWRWTWYSQRVLPGGGLKIPGRHVSGRYVCDGDGYICLASGKLKRGTVVQTPFGRPGKVYDSGCAAGTLDVYTDF